MKKNKIILLTFTLIICSLVSIINFYLTNKIETSNVYDYLYNNLKEDYDDLLELKNIDDSEYRVVGVKVLERNIYSFFDQIIINKGSNDNIIKGDCVVNSNGLVGLVSKVYNNSSVVTLLTNSDLKLSVKVNNSYGIYSNGHIDNIINYEDIALDDEIYTSSLTDTVGNLYIGKVKSISLDDYEIKKEIGVNLLDLSNLKYLYVIGK